MANMGNMRPYWMLAIVFLLARHAWTQESAPASQPAVPQAKTLVTIHLKNTTAEIAVQELSKASGLNITGVSPAMQRPWPITLDADKQPFWIVMHEFLRQSGMTLPQSAAATDVPRIALGIRPPSQTAPAQPVQSHSVGAFLFVPTSITRTHEMEFGQPDQPANTINLLVRAYADPQLTVVGPARVLETVEAIDENGNSLKLPVQPRVGDAVANSLISQYYTLSASLNYSPPMGKTLKHFKGVARFKLITKEDVWQISEMADVAGAERKFPGGKYIITSLGPAEPVTARGLTSNVATYALQFRTIFDSGPGVRNAIGSPLNEVGSLRKAIRVADGLGNTLAIRDFRGQGNPANREYTMILALAGPAGEITSLPAKLEWKIPVEVSDVVVPVEFRDLPLP